MLEEGGPNCLFQLLVPVVGSSSYLFKTKSILRILIWYIIDSHGKWYALVSCPVLERSTHFSTTWLWNLSVSHKAFNSSDFRARGGPFSTAMALELSLKRVLWDECTIELWGLFDCLLDQVISFWRCINSLSDCLNHLRSLKSCDDLWSK